MNYRTVLVAALLFANAGVLQAKAKPKSPVKLSEQLLSYDPDVRVKAVQAFNKLPPDAQYRLVPDFMVAMEDPNPEKRKIAARILKAMNVKVEENLPDTQQLLEMKPSTVTAPSPQETMKEIRSEKKETPKAESLKATTGEPSRKDMYKEIQSEKRSAFAEMQKEIDAEKKEQVNLDPAAFRSQATGLGAISPVLDALKDPDPWVRAQAARRLATIHPAPVDAIPTLITMLKDKEVESRRAAAAALGSMGPLARESIPALNTILADPDPAVRQIAADALRQVQQIR